MNIIKRSEWGAREPNYPFKKHSPNKITIHHVGSSDNKPIIKSFAGKNSIKSIESYHIDKRGWNNIGYHYIIAPNGDIYEGRPDDVVGAHVRNHNTNNIGINIWCNSDIEVPTDNQIKSLKELLNNLFKIYNIDIKDVYGHKDLVSTDCPGTNLYNILNAIKSTWKTPDKETDILVLLHDISNQMLILNQKMAKVVEHFNKHE